jgi:hypothetical protein
MKAIGYTATIIGLMFFSAIFSGYALSVLWDWFVVPYFGVAAISIPLAIGLALIVQYLTHQEQKTEPGKDVASILIEGFVRAIFKPLFALAFGWIVTLWL